MSSIISSTKHFYYFTLPPLNLNFKFSFNPNLTFCRYKSIGKKSSVRQCFPDSFSSSFCCFKSDHTKYWTKDWIEQHYILSYYNSSVTFPRTEVGLWQNHKIRLGVWRSWAPAFSLSDKTLQVATHLMHTSWDQALRVYYKFSSFFFHLPRESSSYSICVRRECRRIWFQNFSEQISSFI